LKEGEGINQQTDEDLFKITSQNLALENPIKFLELEICEESKEGFNNFSESQVHNSNNEGYNLNRQKKIHLMNLKVFKIILTTILKVLIHSKIQ